MKKKAIIGLLLLLVLVATGCTSTSLQNKANTITRQTAEITSVPVTANPVRKAAKPTLEKVYGYDFDSTWGDLIANEGRMVWDTLTREQQAMVHYPKLDMYKVYWAPKGKSYHAVDWCYTLSKSKDIQQGPLSEAIRNGLDPCSKCVGE